MYVKKYKHYHSHTLHKTITLAHPSIDKSKFATNLSYTVIIRRFQRRLNVIMSLYN